MTTRFEKIEDFFRNEDLIVKWVNPEPKAVFHWTVGGVTYEEITGDLLFLLHSKDGTHSGLQNAIYRMRDHLPLDGIMSVVTNLAPNVSGPYNITIVKRTRVVDFEVEGLVVNSCVHVHRIRMRQD